MPLVVNVARTVTILGIVLVVVQISVAFFGGGGNCSASNSNNYSRLFRIGIAINTETAD